MSNITNEQQKKFYSRYHIQRQMQSNSRVYVNTTQQYNSYVNHNDEFGMCETEVKQLYEISLFEEGLNNLIKDTIDYHDFINWIRRDPAAYKVYEQYKIMKILQE